MSNKTILSKVKEKLNKNADEKVKRRGNWFDIDIGDGVTLSVTYYSNKGPLVNVIEEGKDVGQARLDLATKVWTTDIKKN
ncbi:hypothetical protein N9948_01050 [bacterium]|nr:hypothetical protein [bacterium]